MRGNPCSNPHRNPHPIHQRPVARVPTLHDYLLQVRMELKWSRRRVADVTGISEPYLRQVEIGKRVPSTGILRKLIAGYQLAPAQAAYIDELLTPPVPLTPLDILRNRLNQTPTLIDYLTELGDRGVLGVYSDPIGNVLAMNKLMSNIFTDLEEIGNMMKWWFSPVAPRVIPEWEAESDFLVGTFKAAFGRHRTAPAANQLLRHLRRHRSFTQSWVNSTFVAYNRATTHPIRLRPPSGSVLTTIIHRADVTDSRQIVLHTAYPRLGTTHHIGARPGSCASSSERESDSQSNSCTAAPI